LVSLYVTEHTGLDHAGIFGKKYRAVRGGLKNIPLAALLLRAFVIVGLLVHGVLFSSQPVVALAEVAAVALMVWACLIIETRSFSALANPSTGRSGWNYSELP
jgi:hypothetical protein